MNGYKLQAEAYKKVLEQDRENMAPEDIEVMEEKIKVFNILADFTDEDKYYAHDSSMFNDILLGYIKKALDNLIESSDEKAEAASLIRDGLMREIRYLLDTMGSRQAEKFA